MTVYYQFNILPKKSTVHHEMAWFTNYQNNARMMSARKQTLFLVWERAILYKICMLCTDVLDVQPHSGSTLNTVEVKIWMRSFTGSFCYGWLAKGRRHPKATGHHTASFVAHDGQTEQLGLLLAMTVGSCHLKNFLSVVNVEKEFYDLSLLFQIGNFFEYNANEQITRSERR